MLIIPNFHIPVLHFEHVKQLVHLAAFAVISVGGTIGKLLYDIQSVD